MMNCEQFLESIDAFVDDELSPEDASTADGHRRTCASCGRAVAQRLVSRQSLKRLAETVELPAHLEARVMQSVRPWWQLAPQQLIVRPAVGVIAAVMVALALVVAVLGPPALSAKTANTLDRLAVDVDDTSAVVVRGTVLCRDCELSHRYGIESSCQRIGHHGAVFTSNGVILNLVEQRSSSRLIHDEALFGKQVVIRGRLLRGARALSVDSFDVES
jgi:hypothetical protein